MVEASDRFSLATRAVALERLKRETVDVLVIGGGITGAGVALDAVSRGLSVGLVEKRDFASGTSSRSSKLIHGGLRYLEHFEFSLVREALQERATLTRIAPHLSEPLQFLVPVYKPGYPSPLGNSRLKLGAGLWLYDLLAGRKNIGSHRWLDRDETLEVAPLLNAEGLRGAFLYYDCLTNDSRLVIEVIKAASQRGAAIANYTEVRRLEREGSFWRVALEDKLTGERLESSSRVVVNATGVWSDETARLHSEEAPRTLRPSKGIHVVISSESFPKQTAILIPSAGEKRFLFVIPWFGRTLIGTTDTDYSGELDSPLAEEREIYRLVESTVRSFPMSGVSTESVISSFAGLRPLVSENGQSTAEVSRKEELREGPVGLISIIGGKLTTYRQMAERVTDMAVTALHRNGALTTGPCMTREISLARSDGLTGDEREAVDASASFGVPLQTLRHLMKTYGGNYTTILEIAAEDEELKDGLSNDLPHIAAEVVYATRHEMAASVEDFLERRTRIALLTTDHGESCSSQVRELMLRYS